MGTYTFKEVTDKSIYDSLNMLGQLNPTSIKQCVESFELEKVLAITPNRWKERYDRSSKYAMHRELGATTPVKAVVMQRPCEIGVYKALAFAIHSMQKDEGRHHGEPYKLLEHFAANETPISLRLCIRDGNIDLDITTIDTSLEEDLLILNLIKNKVNAVRDLCLRIELNDIGIEGVIKICAYSAKKGIHSIRHRQYKRTLNEWLDIMIESTEKEIEKQVV